MTFGSRNYFAVLLMWLALIASGCRSPISDTKALRVGAWNIENLGTRHSDSRQRVPAQNPEEMADYIIASGVEILALEEIHDDEQTTSETPGRAPWRNQVLEKTLEIIERKTGGKWEYLLTPPNALNERQQMTGVAWNTKAVTFKGREIVPVTSGTAGKADFWARQPEGFLFSAGPGLSDFVVVPLHMKSNSGGREQGEAARKEEAKQLMMALPEFKMKIGDEDVVLIGDSNMLAGEESARMHWGTAFRDLNADERYTYIKPYRNEPFPPFDRIFVPAGQPEFRQSRQQIHGPYGASDDDKKAWQRIHLHNLSDHLLIWTEVAIMHDDD